LDETIYRQTVISAVKMIPPLLKITHNS
jgi:hypothetical protein